MLAPHSLLFNIYLSHWGTGTRFTRPVRHSIVRWVVLTTH